MAQEIGAAVIGLVSWELKGLLLHWKPITGAPVRNRTAKIGEITKGILYHYRSL